MGAENGACVEVAIEAAACWGRDWGDQSESWRRAAYTLALAAFGLAALPIV